MGKVKHLSLDKSVSTKFSAHSLHPDESNGLFQFSFQKLSFILPYISVFLVICAQYRKFEKIQTYKEERIFKKLFIVHCLKTNILLSCIFHLIFYHFFFLCNCEYVVIIINFCIWCRFLLPKICQK